MKKNIKKYIAMMFYRKVQRIDDFDCFYLKI
jgi:hypothetical protein